MSPSRASGPDAPMRGPSVWVPPVLVAGLLFALGASTASGGWAGHTPMLWFLLLTVVCVRHRTEPWAGTLFLPALLLFSLWFVGAARAVTVPFGVGLLLAYLLDPVIDRMEPRLGRSRAIVLLAIPVVIALTALGMVLIPALIGEATQLARRLPELREPLEALSLAVQQRLQAAGIDLEWTSVGDFLLPRLEAIAGNLVGAGVGVWRGVQGLVEAVSFVVITPVVGFYLLRDFDRIRDGLVRGLPEDKRQDVESFFERVDRAVSGYLRGQLLVGVVIGVAFAVGLTALGMDYALLVGLSAVVLNLVPYVGSVLTAVLAIAVALLSDPSWTSLLKVGALYAVVQLLDGAILSPRIMGSSLALHPVVVMLAVLIGGQFLGVIGVVIAVPVAAVLRESFSVWASDLLELLPSGDGGRAGGAAKEEAS